MMMKVLFRRDFQRVQQLEGDLGHNRNQLRQALALGRARYLPLLSSPSGLALSFGAGFLFERRQKSGRKHRLDETFKNLLPLLRFAF